MKDVLRAATDRILGLPSVRSATLKRAARCQRSAVLIWHRVSPEGPGDHEVVPTVPTEVFCAQLDALAELGDIVPLAVLEEASEVSRPRFALTFDDDDLNHARHTLPVLEERELAATFFLSGRWRYGYGPYWWEVLEQRIQELGPQTVAADLGLPPDRTPAQIAAAISGTDMAAAFDEEGRSMTMLCMARADAMTLVAAGMEIGFHTIHHPLLTALEDAEIPGAVRDGRKELVQDLGTPVDRFAYPHGRTDARVTAAASAAGYHSAWTTAKRVLTPSTPPLLGGRWDVGQRSGEQVRAMLLRALARPPS